MAYFPSYKVAITLVILLLSLSSFSAYKPNPSDTRDSNYYSNSCPQIFSTVLSGVQAAIQNETRMGASLLRLHFHDCFVNGCDASILLDDTASFKGEKRAAPNLNSARGFEVIYGIKKQLEAICPTVVSCADILALVARDSVVQLGGPSWGVKFGRLDSLTASQAAANTSIPPPTSSLANLTARFQQLGLTSKDLVALSGSHTIGQARCTSFRAHIYNETNIDSRFAKERRGNCPSTSGSGDDNLAGLDTQTQDLFDNNYHKNLVNKRGLLHSDQELYSNGVGSTDSIVTNYANNPYLFYIDFAAAMVKMGDLKPPAGSKGEIRKDCRKPNPN